MTRPVVHVESYRDPLISVVDAGINALDAELVPVESDAALVPAPVDLDALYPNAYSQAYDEEFDAWVHRSLLHRIADDPYWIIIGTSIVLVTSIIGVATYGAIQIVLLIAEFVGLYGKSLVTLAALIGFLVFCAGGRAVVKVCGCCGK